VKLSLYPYQLQFKFPFRIAHGVRTYTDVVYVKLQHEGFTSWGEATLPPYLPETQTSVIEFLTEFSKDISPNSIDDWFGKLQPVNTNLSAKAALDVALWNLKSQIESKTIGELLGIKSKEFPLGTYTLGVSSLDEMKIKIVEANQAGFQIFKIKLNGESDEEQIRNYKNLSNNKFAVDVNQGWVNVEEAGDKIVWLKEEGCFLVEQPFSKDSLIEAKLLKQKSVLPLYADESCQRLRDIERLRDSFDGVNIKLMKCGGITEAHQMILKARELDMKILIGCMSESSVGCTAAAHLTPLADYADLDGPYLICNDPFSGMKTKEGRIAINPFVQVGEL
jgi:L-alanine-DL-glutamate epimerase-like enolase superfamily enzyme